MAEHIWKEWFPIRSFQTDFRSCASMPTICRLLQETAGNHAQDLGVPIDVLQAQGLTWVLSRFHVHIHQPPQWRERIRVETWPANALGFYVVRDFKLCNEQEEHLVSASSIWLILDMKKRVPQRIPDYIVAMSVPEQGRAIDDPFDTIWRPQTVTLEKRFTVRSYDIDLNQHVNNVSYVEWALETVPDEVWKRHQIIDIEVSFRMETRYGDVVVSQSDVAEENGLSLVTHRIIRESDGIELFLARTRWQPGATPFPR